MLDELEALIEATRDRVENEGNQLGEADQRRAKAQDTTNAELLLFQQEVMIRVRENDGNYNNPLLWWKNNNKGFPLLWEMALRFLSIPATSAPSERVFSTAGITIAKDRARLDPANANELVFLHESLPALKKFEDSYKR